MNISIIPFNISGYEVKEREITVHSISGIEAAIRSLLADKTVSAIEICKPVVGLCPPEEDGVERREKLRDGMQCNNCSFFLAGKPGVCRRHPPRLLANNMPSAFPDVNDIDWCGEYYPRWKNWDWDDD